MRNRILPILVAALVALPAARTLAAEPLAPTAADTFTRAAIGGWSTADTGGPWAPLNQPESFAIGRGQATIRLPEAGASRAVIQPEVVAADQDLAATFAFDRLPTGGNAFAYLVARHTDASELRLKARIDETGQVFLQPTTVVGKEEHGVGEEATVPGLILAPGDAFRLRAQVVGTIPTALRMRAWRAGAAEPESWPVQANDTFARVKGPGSPGVRAYVGSSVTDVPLAVTVDDWSVVGLDATGSVPPSPSPGPTPTVEHPPLAIAEPAYAPGTRIAHDRFERVLERAWLDAESGGRWSHLGGGDDFRTERGVGVMTVPAGETRTALLPVLQRDLMASASLRAQTLPADGNAWAYLVLRQTEGGEVRGRARIAPDGGVHLSVSVVENGEERQLGPEIRPDGLTTGTQEAVRLRFAGIADPTTGTTRWKLKGWPASAAEPDGWTLQVDDATPSLQGAGAAGLRAYVGRSVSVPAVTLAIDEVDVLTADPTTGEADPVIAGAGDIATCGSRGSERTATLLERLPATATVMAVGDLANRDGTPEQFTECYDPTWGRFRDRTLPVPGNRDYVTPDAKGYFDYWGERAAAPGGWQAIDLGTWRVYALNAECEFVDCRPDSAQLRWLLKDLAENPRTCSMAIMHEPRFTSGPHGSQRDLQPMWEALVAAGVELVVSGHDHGYERFLPLDASGNVDTRSGTVQFVAGTGGSGSVEYAVRRAGSVVRDGESLGVLRLTLRPDGYDWRFLPALGDHFTDSGRAACH
jgi:hypothetical protein